jgi:hypothetical protein
MNTSSNTKPQRTVTLSLWTCPLLFILSFWLGGKKGGGFRLSKVRGSLPRQTDRLQGRVSEEWRHKEQGSPTWFELLLGGTEREIEMVPPLHQRAFRCFYRLRPTDWPCHRRTTVQRLAGRYLAISAGEEGRTRWCRQLCQWINTLTKIWVSFSEVSVISR